MQEVHKTLTGFPRMRGDEPSHAPPGPICPSFPRMRGDEPARGQGKFVKTSFSPHARG